MLCSFPYLYICIDLLWGLRWERIQFSTVSGKAESSTHKLFLILFGFNLACSQMNCSILQKKYWRIWREEGSEEAFSFQFLFIVLQDFLKMMVSATEFQKILFAAICVVFLKRNLEPTEVFMDCYQKEKWNFKTNILEGIFHNTLN